jgi:hypothetical protein
MPNNDAELEAASVAFNGIMSGIADFDFGTCLAQIVDANGSQELTMIVDEFEYDGSWYTQALGILRLAIENDILAHASIDNIGSIDINLVKPQPCYLYVPQVDRVDNRTGFVYFKDEIPPGAQIEVYRYARKLRGSNHGPYIRNGKRWRPDQLLAVGQLTFDAGSFQRSAHGRTHFRFAYRWPATPGSTAPAPGERGPLSAFTISTSNPHERLHGCRLVIVASPSTYGNNNS